jgi:hypothetical protein
MSSADKFNYDDLHFRSVNNSESGEVSSDTIFHYHQIGDIMWATYRGGEIRFGTMTGTIGKNGQLTFAYQHVNVEGVIRTGRCLSIPEMLPDGRIRLNENWQWTDEEGATGTSIVEEVRP